MYESTRRRRSFLLLPLLLYASSSIEGFVIIPTRSSTISSSKVFKSRHVPSSLTTPSKLRMSWLNPNGGRKQDDTTITHKKSDGHVKSALELKVEEFTQQFLVIHNSDSSPNNNSSSATIANVADSMAHRQLEARALKLQEELIADIRELYSKLDAAEAATLRERILNEETKEQQSQMEHEISKLRQQYEEGTDYRYLYEDEQKKLARIEADSEKRIAELQEEVRVVFSIGRRTSDRLVEDLVSQLENKESVLQMTLSEIDSKNCKIASLEADRKSLRKLMGLSWNVSYQRIARRLGGFRIGMRKKILGSPLSKDSQKSADADSQSTIRVGKQERRR